LANAAGWGIVQTRLQNGLQAYPTVGGVGTLWISALPIPAPERAFRALRLEAASDDPLIVGGLTLFHGTAHPLRQEKLSLYRLTLPPTSTEEKDRWAVNVD